MTSKLPTPPRDLAGSWDPADCTDDDERELRQQLESKGVDTVNLLSQNQITIPIEPNILFLRRLVERIEKAPLHSRDEVRRVFLEDFHTDKAQTEKLASAATCKLNMAELPTEIEADFLTLLWSRSWTSTNWAIYKLIPYLLEARHSEPRGPLFSTSEGSHLPQYTCRTSVQRSSSGAGAGASCKKMDKKKLRVCSIKTNSANQCKISKSGRTHSGPKSQPTRRSARIQKLSETPR